MIRCGARLSANRLNDCLLNYPSRCASNSPVNEMAAEKQVRRSPSEQESAATQGGVTRSWMRCTFLRLPVIIQGTCIPLVFLGLLEMQLLPARLAAPELQRCQSIKKKMSRRLPVIKTREQPLILYPYGVDFVSIRATQRTVQLPKA